MLVTALNVDDKFEQFKTRKGAGSKTKWKQTYSYILYIRENLIPPCIPQTQSLAISISKQKEPKMPFSERIPDCLKALVFFMILSGNAFDHS